MTTPVKWGSEFLVNSNTYSTQSNPAVAVLADGRFVIAYEDNSGETSFTANDTVGAAVRLEIFNADGSRFAGPLQANTVTGNSQDTAAVAALADGGFAVVYEDSSGGAESGNDDTSSTAVRMQLFSSDGGRLGAEQKVNSVVNSIQDDPDIAVLSSGRIVVVYDDLSRGGETGFDDTSSYAVRAEIFSANGTRLEGGILVNTLTQSAQDNASVAGLDQDDRFVVVYEDSSGLGEDASGSGVRGQVFNGDGTRYGAEFQVNTTTSGSQYRPEVTGLSGGRFVVVWDDYSRGVETGGDDANSYAVRGQVFGSHGLKIGDEFLVNTITTLQQQYADVTALSDGRFIVVWRDGSYGAESGGDDTDNAVRAQVFNPNGTKSGDEFLVNTTTTGTQGDPKVAELKDGRIVITWEDNSQGVETLGDDTSSYAVRAQIFDPREEAADWSGTAMGEQYVGTNLADVLDGAGGDDVLSGMGGNDKLFGGHRHDTLDGGEGKDLLDGGQGRDSLDGGTANDRLFGGNGRDTLFGGVGNDRLDGGRHGDAIEGGSGKDILKGGGGYDVFVFRTEAETGVGVKGRDKILDFKPGIDVIDLHRLDADTDTPTNDAFSWIGTGKFTGTEGELRYMKTKKLTIVQGDTDGDGKADFEIELRGKVTLGADDFFL